MACAKVKRKLWTEESMKAATNGVVNENLTVREASRLYNVPYETLRRRVNGSVEPGSRPGPATVLTEEEEDQLESYLIKMSDMGFGLSRDTVMHLAYKIVEQTQRKHPFKDQKAGRGWFDGFRRRHPRLTIRSPQPLSYARAQSANMDTINDFFGKLGSMYGRLNLITKPMQLYNCDETGVSVVHKPGKVVAELGRRNVPAVTSAERGKTHTILTCVSAAGYVLPPMMIYPRKQLPPAKFRDGAVPQTLFANSSNGWINSDLFFRWFEFFLEHIPPTRPVLLIMDGHGSHMSIKLIELARCNDVHILCLPSHTTHVLQPLDVGVFKSFKSHFSKACSKYLAANPGKVITSDKLASLVAEAWPHSLTALNVMSGFKKCGIFPLNPSEVTDRQIAPSKLFKQQSTVSDSTASENPTDDPLFSPDKVELYKKRYEEGYDLDDPDYLAWLKINHPTEVSSTTTKSSSSLVSGENLKDSKSSSASGKSKVSSSDALSEILVIPSPISRPMTNRKPALNAKTVVITNDSVLEDLKRKEVEKDEGKKEKEAKKLEREHRKKVREEKRLAKEHKKKECAEKTTQRQRGKQTRSKKTEKRTPFCDALAALQLSSSCDEDDSSQESETEDEDNTTCPKCGIRYGDSTEKWFACEGCNQWFNKKCTNIKRREPEYYYCEKCTL